VRIVNNYLFSSILSMTGIVLLVLLALGGFIEFLSQMDEIGQGDYDMVAALQYVLLKLPRLGFGLLPVSMLLGALLGLGALASNSELIILRAAGVSLWRMAASVITTGIAIALVGGIIGELIAPKLDLYARQFRAEAKGGDKMDIAGARAWIRDGNTIFNVQPAIDGIDQGGVYSFELEFPNGLAAMGRADAIEAEDEEWALRGLAETRFEPDRVTRSEDVDPQRYDKLGELLSISVVRDASMTGIELYRYVRYLQSNGLDAERYAIAFWSRMATVAGIALMCVLALPFVFGNLRQSGAGTRMMIGAIIGLGYFLLNRTMADSAAVFDLPPLMVAFVPTLLLAGVTALLLARVR
jgi:lipopolysaccharide export system permease protein